MTRVLEQILPGERFDIEANRLSAYFRRVGVRDFEAELLYPRIDQLYTWFFLQGKTGYCLKYIAQDCLKKIRLGGRNGRERRYREAAAIFATRIHAWLDHEGDYFLSQRLYIAGRALCWANMVQGWGFYRYPAHCQLAGELKPRLNAVIQKLSSVKPVILTFEAESKLVQKTLF